MIIWIYGRIYPEFKKQEEEKEKKKKKKRKIKMIILNLI